MYGRLPCDFGLLPSETRNAYPDTCLTRASLFSQDILRVSPTLATRALALDWNARSARPATASTTATRERGSIAAQINPSASSSRFRYA